MYFITALVIMFLFIYYPSNAVKFPFFRRRSLSNSRSFQHFNCAIWILDPFVVFFVCIFCAELPKTCQTLQRILNQDISCRNCWPVQLQTKKQMNAKSIVCSTCELDTACCNGYEYKNLQLCNLPYTFCLSKLSLLTSFDKRSDTHLCI